MEALHLRMVLWLTGRTMLLTDADITIAEASGEGMAYRCSICGKIFAEPSDLTAHFARTHPPEVKRGWSATGSRLIQTVESKVQRNQPSAEEADQPVDTSTGGLLREALRLRIPRPRSTALQAPPEDVQSAAPTAYGQKRVREVQQKLQEHFDVERIPALPRKF
jgi:uncharacterized C2H2 Zn-finger protein